MQERLVPQPVEQLIAIRRSQDVAERVLRFQMLAGRQRDGEQVQIVVAEDRDRGAADRLWLVGDLVNRGPQAVAARIEAQLREERFELDRKSTRLNSSH